MLQMYLPDNKSWFNRVKTLISNQDQNLEQAADNFFNGPDNIETATDKTLTDIHKQYIYELARMTGMLKACLSIAPNSLIDQNKAAQQEVNKAMYAIMLPCHDIVSCFLTGYSSVLECYDILDPTIGVDQREFIFSKKSSRFILTESEQKRKENILHNSTTFMLLKVNFKY